MDIENESTSFMAEFTRKTFPLVLSKPSASAMFKKRKDPLTDAQLREMVEASRIIIADVE